MVFITFQITIIYQGAKGGIRTLKQPVHHKMRQHKYLNSTKCFTEIRTRENYRSTSNRTAQPTSQQSADTRILHVF